MAYCWPKDDDEELYSFANQLSPLNSRSEYAPPSWADEFSSLDYTIFEETISEIKNDHCNNDDIHQCGHGASSSSKSIGKMLSLETISHYFYMPMAQAAENLNVSVTTLKKRCRELQIKRWPNRKLNSLRNLEKNIKEMGRDEKELEFLEKQRKLIEEVPDLQPEEKTRRLRSAYYKAKSYSRSEKPYV